MNEPDDRSHDTVPTDPGDATGGGPVIDMTSLELGDDVVFVTERDGTIVDVNEAFVRVTGYSRREALGATPRLLSSGYQDDAFYAELWQTISRGEVWEGQLVDRRRDGALRTHHVTISPVRDSRGVITHFVAVERDLTAELGRQVTLGSSGLVHTDVTGRCVYADGRAAALLDRPPSQLLGGGLLRALEPDDAEALREVVSMAGEQGRDHRLDVRSREGTWFSVEVGALTVPSGRTIGAVLALEDVSEHLAVHRELARRDAFVTSVLDAVPDPLAVLSVEGTVLAVNAVWRTATGPAATRALRTARVGDDLPRVLDAAAERGDQHARQLRERLGRALSGHPVGAREGDAVHLSPLRWEEGGVVLRISPEE